jgi:glyoxylase-like metal-dependent hydrolase (beta-lactamase superfamily II)
MPGRWLGLFLAVIVIGGCASAPGGPASVTRMVVLQCGENSTKDVSPWSPGVNVGEPRVFSNNCYLIQHGPDWFLWDTGNNDAIALQPDGVQTAGGRLTARMPKTLIRQLQEIGVQPTDIRHLAFSHMHGDHCGNGNYFTAATLYMQRVEYEAAFGPDVARFNYNPATYGDLRNNHVLMLSGDFDVFGDGSIVIVATPGHTIGHQSLFVRLPRSGPVVLSGDLAHFRENWEARRVPAINYDREQTLASMQKIDTLLQATGAQLWINHDRTQSDRIPHAPESIE